jgi:hypothetical protein
MPASLRPDGAARNARLALVCGGVFVAMVGAAFASAPLYKAFCSATGFNGAVRTGAAPPGVVSSDTVTVRFDTNVRGLAWRFEPAQGPQTARLGESKLAFFRATNTGPVAVTGRALYNVLPEWAGAYFSKLECFCFKVPGGLLRRPQIRRRSRPAREGRDHALLHLLPRRRRKGCRKRRAASLGAWRRAPSKAIARRLMARGLRNIEWRMKA